MMLSTLSINRILAYWSVLSCWIISGISYAQPTEMVLNRDGIVVRSGPGNYYPVKRILDYDSKISIQDSTSKPGWLYIKVIGDNYGWISSNSIRGVERTAQKLQFSSGIENAGVTKIAVGAMIKGLLPNDVACLNSFNLAMQVSTTDTVVHKFRSQFTDITSVGKPLLASEYGLKIVPEIIAASSIIATELVNQNGGRDEPLEEYCNEIILWITDRIGAENIPAYVFVSKGGHDAFCLPGGYIVLGSEMTNDLHNEAELAGILAHELAHTIYEHGEKRLITKSRLMGIEKKFETLDDLTLSEKDSTIKYLESVVDDLRDGLERRRSIADEYAADSIAINWLLYCGYDNRAFKDYLVRLYARDLDLDQDDDIEEMSSKIRERMELKKRIDRLTSILNINQLDSNLKYSKFEERYNYYLNN